MAYIKTDDIHKDIAEDVETKFYTSRYEWDKPLPKGKNKKVIGFNERWFRWKNNDNIWWIT